MCGFELVSREGQVWALLRNVIPGRSLTWRLGSLQTGNQNLEGGLRQAWWGIFWLSQGSAFFDKDFKGSKAEITSWCNFG